MPNFAVGRASFGVDAAREEPFVVQSVDAELQKHIRAKEI
jgi:hypothetical protein